ncbi:MAG TPA: DUF4129 domain-containing protein [Armatimonadota bacterium]|nr:DUF4129 domain-containing protein [Armatimonadota bacterium]HUV05839.1 DUF4129 domain-containing protein [Armatimonadota bacterium]
MIRRRFLSLILLVWCLQGPALAVTASEYDRYVASAATGVESALSKERAHAGSSSRVLDDLTRTIPSSVVVENSDGSKILADLSWARADISSAQRLKGKKRADKLQDLAARLRTLEDASKSRQSGATVSAEKARNTLAKTLAGKEYQKSLMEGVAQRVLAWVLRSLERIIGPGTGEVISWVLLVGLVIGAAALLVFLVLHVINSRSPKRRKVVPPTIRQSRVERPTSKALLLRAEEDARAGRFREAIRAIYLAGILHLDGRRFVTYEEGTTNWEYTHAARRLAPPDAAALFGDMTMRFDDLIYGQRTVTDDEYSTFIRSYQELEETV